MAHLAEPIYQLAISQLNLAKLYYAKIAENLKRYHEHGLSHFDSKRDSLTNPGLVL